MGREARANKLRKRDEQVRRVVTRLRGRPISWSEFYEDYKERYSAEAQTATVDKNGYTVYESGRP
jgi:hypothetical protein